ncbi:MAG: hypothetical protein KA330_10770 [Chitinophagaceae bacterium]|nr:hypothetical protein [Chitinophagaceae bacterium]
MKKYLIILSACLVIISCNNKADQPGADDDTATAAELVYSWQAVLNDSTGRLEMKKSEAAGPDSLSPAAVITYLNTLNTNVRLELVKTSGDTVYVKIPDAMYLTQQMGSTGPTLYFSEAVYNLTEIPGIRFVNFDFEEGDHASPGTLNRESFNNE